MIITSSIIIIKIDMTPECWLVERMDDIDKDDVVTLGCLLPADPSPGFRILVRYVDTLCGLHSIPVVDVVFRNLGGVILIMDQAKLLHRTRKSLVIQQFPHSQSVIKIGPANLLRQEIRLHDLVDDGCEHIRRCVSSGIVDGVGVENGNAKGALLFIELEGLGEHLASKHVIADESMVVCFDQTTRALKHMHSKKVLHRDLKPSNIMIINGIVKLNDFDCSCLQSDNVALQQMQVGTSKFQSPFMSEKYCEQDDWIGLILTFLSLRIDIQNKVQSLHSALELTWVPQSMKECIRSNMTH